MKTAKSKWHIILCLIAVFLVLDQVANGQVSDTVLTLDDCIKLSYLNNSKLKQARIEADKSHYKYNEAISAGLPQLAAFGSAEDYFDIPVTMVSGDIFGQPGATLPIQLGTKYNLNAGIQLGQMIFNASYFASLQLFKKSCEISDLNLRKGEEELVYNVYKIYCFIQISNLQLAIIDSNIAAFESVCKFSEQHYLNGFISNSDFSRVKVVSNNLEAEKVNLMSSLDQQINMLKYLIGIEQNKRIVLSDYSESIEFPMIIEDTTFDRNIDVLILERQRELAELNLKLTRSADIPSVTGYAGYSYQTQNERFNSFKDSENWFRTSFVGIKITIPIFEGGRDRFRVKQNRADLEQTLIARDDLKSELNMNFLNASQKLLASKALVSKLKDNVILAEKIFRVTNEQYGQGLKSLTDVLNVRTEYNASCISWLEALLQVKLSELEVIKINGGFLKN